jgi:hypothetical protein
MFLFSCGDIFSYKKNIVGNYEIRDDEGVNGKSIYYKLNNGDAIGRIENIDSIGWNDSIIVAKSPKGYYILYMKKDSAFAEPANVVFGPAIYDTFIRQLNVTKNEIIKFKIGFK